MVNRQPLTPHIMPTLVIPTSWRSYRTTDSVTSFHPIYLAKLQTRTWLSRALFSAFYRAMLCIRGTSHGPVSVCPSVRPSVTSRCSTKTAKRRITQTTTHDSPGTSETNDLREIRPGSPPTGALNAGGVGQNR